MIDFIADMKASIKKHEKEVSLTTSQGHDGIFR